MQNELRERYHSMGDEELEQIAEDWPSLTDAARQALELEFHDRGLPSPRPAPQDRPQTPSESPLVTIQSYDNAAGQELLFAVGMLRSAGIECFVSDQHTSRAEGSGIAMRLQVREEDVADALELLDHPFDEDSVEEN